MRTVSFRHSDIEGAKAILVIEQHADGSVSSVKLTADECLELSDIAENNPTELVTPPEYSNIRECLGHLIGRTIEDITQHDREEFTETRRSYVQLLLSGGDYIKFFVGVHGFQHSEDDPKKGVV